MTILRHSLDPDDDQVWLRVGPSAVRVSICEAKRFAWALLNDLEPDEATSALMTTVQSAPTIPGGFGKWVVLMAVRDGRSTAREIAHLLRMKREAVSVMLSNHRRDGHATVAYLPGSKCIWSVTDAGRQALERAERSMAQHLQIAA